MRAPASIQRFGLDALLVLLTVFSVAFVALDDDAPTSALVLSVLMTAPLLARRVAPLPAAMVSLGGLAALGQTYDPAAQTIMALVVTMIACWTLGALRDRRQGVTGLVCAFGLALIAVDGNPGALDLTDVAFTAVLVGAPFAAASAYRAADLRAGALASRQAEEAVRRERARIARELHDIVGHALSVIALQAGGARVRLKSDPAAVAEPLDAIQEAAHEALDEMRRLVRILREDDDAGDAAPPGLDRLGELVARLADSGLDVDVETEGTRRRLPPGVDVTAFRIVQEALTNALRHGRGQARLRLRYDPEELDLEVENAIGVAARGGGHGLVGMRERVALYGGRLDAGAAGGVFRLHVTLPAGELR